MKTFKKTNKSLDGTYYQKTINISYQNLVEIFGKPNGQTDKYKTTMEWDLENEKGNVVSIYDYKMTSLYDKLYPAPKEFKNDKAIDFRIGGFETDVADALYKYIESKIQ